MIDQSLLVTSTAAMQAEARTPLGSDRQIDSAFRVPRPHVARASSLRFEFCARHAHFGFWLRQRTFTMSKNSAPDAPIGQASRDDTRVQNRVSHIPMALRATSTPGAAQFWNHRYRCEIAAKKIIFHSMRVARAEIDVIPASTLGWLTVLSFQRNPQPAPRKEI